jgi:hypothetical protein
MPDKNQAQAPQKQSQQNSKARRGSGAINTKQSACGTQGESSEECVDERIQEFVGREGSEEERIQDRLEEQSQAQNQARRDVYLGAPREEKKDSPAPKKRQQKRA